jgi:hypothetical protein
MELRLPGVEVVLVIGLAGAGRRGDGEFGSPVRATGKRGGDMKRLFKVQAFVSASGRVWDRSIDQRNNPTFIWSS